MGSIDMNLDEIETMLARGTLNARQKKKDQEHATSFSIIADAFPHMFPVSTNQWRRVADRRSRCTDTSRPRTCGAISEILSASRGCLEDRLRGEPCKSGRK